MLKIKLSSKGCTQGVSYIDFKEITINNPLEDKMLFTVENLVKEVGQNIKKIKQLKKFYRKLMIVLGPKLLLTKSAFAATPVLAATTPALATQAISPALILHWGFMLASLTVSIGLAISMSLLGIAGIYRMFKRRDEATEWSTDIIRGLVQTLVAVPIVYVIFTLAQHLFKALPSISGLSF